MNFRRAFRFSFFSRDSDNAGFSGTVAPVNGEKYKDNYFNNAARADEDIMDHSGEKNEYLKSFNKIVLKDANTLIINNRYSIVRQNLGGCYLFTLSNMNEYWKEDISFSQSFDRVDLDKVIDDGQYQIRYFHFSLWSQDRYCGRLVLRFGYEDATHEYSKKIYDFFNVIEPKVPTESVD